MSNAPTHPTTRTPMSTPNPPPAGSPSPAGKGHNTQANYAPGNTPNPKAPPQNVPVADQTSRLVATPVSNAANKPAAPIQQPSPQQVADHECEHERLSDPQPGREPRLPHAEHPEHGKGSGKHRAHASPTSRWADVEVHVGDSVVYRERNTVTGEVGDVIGRVTRVEGDRLDLMLTYNVGADDHERLGVAPLEDREGDQPGWRPIG